MRKSLLVLLLLVPLAAQEKGGDKGGGRRPPPEPKNLKVLKVAPAELIPTMRTYTSGLGVQCVFCHVQNDFPNDEKHQKEVARHMITMVQEINAKFPDGKVHVTCYTCHRGETEPKVAAPPATPPAN